MTASSFPPSPEQRHTPIDCAGHGSALSESIFQLERAGLRISGAARLKDAARVLQRVGEVGEFPGDEESQQRLANAMTDASDFFDIARFLPTRTGSRVLSELSRAMKGTLADSRRRQTPYRYQAQFWLGSVLMHGGYDPKVPDADRPHPDFLVQEGISEYGVEVKRPETPESALALLKEGARQLLDYRVKGLIIVDLSECVGLERLRHVSEGQEIELRDEILHTFASVYRPLRDLALDEKNHRLNKDFGNVVGLLGIARGWSWITDSSPGLALFALGGASMFFSPVRTVLYHHSVHLMTKTVRGLRTLGYGFEDFPEVASPFDPLPFAWRL